MTESGLLGIQIGAQGTTSLSAAAVTQSGVAGSVDLFGTQSAGRSSLTRSRATPDKASFRKNLEEMTSALGSPAGAAQTIGAAPATGAAIRLPGMTAAGKDQANPVSDEVAAKLSGGIATQVTEPVVTMANPSLSAMTNTAGPAPAMVDPAHDNPDPTPLPPTDEVVLPVISLSPGDHLPVQVVLVSATADVTKPSPIRPAPSMVRLAQSPVAKRMSLLAGKNADVVPLVQTDTTLSAAPVATLANPPVPAAVSQSGVSAPAVSDSVIPDSNGTLATAVVPSVPVAAIATTNPAPAGSFQAIAGAARFDEVRTNKEMRSEAVSSAPDANVPLVPDTPALNLAPSSTVVPIAVITASILQEAPNDLSPRSAGQGSRVAMAAGEPSGAAPAGPAVAVPMRVGSPSFSAMLGQTCARDHAGVAVPTSEAPLLDATDKMAAQPASGQEPAAAFVQAFHLQARPAPVEVQAAPPIASSYAPHGTAGDAAHVALTLTEANADAEEKDAKDTDGTGPGKDGPSSIDLSRGSDLTHSEVAFRTIPSGLHGDLPMPAVTAVTTPLHVPQGITPAAQMEAAPSNALGVSSAIAGSLLEPLSGAGHRELIDGFAAAQPATLRSTPNLLEVGVASGSHGWLKVRAELDGAGGVSASVITNTVSASQMMHKDLPALSAYLSNESVGVSSLMVNPAAGAGQTAAGLLHHSAMNLGAGAGGGGPARDQGQAPPSSVPWTVEELNVSRFDGESSGVDGVGLMALSAAQREASEPGGWLSVRA